MNVMYLGGVGPFGGASRSLYEAVGALPRGAVKAYFLMPDGTALDFYRRVAVDTIGVRGVTRFDHTRAAHYRGLRWLVTLRELAHVPAMLTGLRRAQAAWPDIDLIHVNEFTEIIPGILAKRRFRVPLVIHVRSLVQTNLKQRRTRWLHRMLRRHADAVIAIDETVAASLPADIPVDVIHNSFTATPIEQPDAKYLAQFEQLRPNALKVGFVGNLLRTKGVVDLVRAAALVRQAGADVQIVIVGGEATTTRGLKSRLLAGAGLAQNARDEVAELICSLGLEQDVLLFGPTADIQRCYPQMDVLAFPSHLDSPGRPVFEAAFFGVPSIVAVRHPTSDTIVNGETGITIDAPSPELVAGAILKLAADRDEVKRLGANAKTLAEQNYLPENNAKALKAVYDRLLPKAR